MTNSMNEFVETLNLEDYQDILIEAQKSQSSSKQKQRLEKAEELNMSVEEINDQAKMIR